MSKFYLLMKVYLVKYESLDNCENCYFEGGYKCQDYGCTDTQNQKHFKYKEITQKQYLRKKVKK